MFRQGVALQSFDTAVLLAYVQWLGWGSCSPQGVGVILSIFHRKGLCVLYSLWGSCHCPPFSTGGHALQTLFPKVMGGGRSHAQNLHCFLLCSVHLNWSETLCSRRGRLLFQISEIEINKIHFCMKKKHTRGCWESPLKSCFEMRTNILLQLKMRAGTIMKEDRFPERRGAEKKC